MKAALHAKPAASEAAGARITKARKAAAQRKLAKLIAHKKHHRQHRHHRVAAGMPAPASGRERARPSRAAVAVSAAAVFFAGPREQLRPESDVVGINAPIPPSRPWPPRRPLACRGARPPPASLRMTSTAPTPSRRPGAAHQTIAIVSAYDDPARPGRPDRLQQALRDTGLHHGEWLLSHAQPVRCRSSAAPEGPDRRHVHHRIIGRSRGGARGLPELLDHAGRGQLARRRRPVRGRRHRCTRRRADDRDQLQPADRRGQRRRLRGRLHAVPARSSSPPPETPAFDSCPTFPASLPGVLAVEAPSSRRRRVATAARRPGA